MAWWEGIWLNEAFATYMQYVCTDAYRPDWKMWVRFSAERELGLTIDGLHSTRSIEFPVRAPAEAMDDGRPDHVPEGRLGPQDARDRTSAPRPSATGSGATWASTPTRTRSPATSGRRSRRSRASRSARSWTPGSSRAGTPIVRVEDGTLTQRPFHLAPPDGPSNIGGPWRVPVRSRPLERRRLDAPAARRRARAARRGAARRRERRRHRLLPHELRTRGAGVHRATRLDALSEIERAVLLGDTWALARAGERTDRRRARPRVGARDRGRAVGVGRRGPDARLPRPGDPTGRRGPSSCSPRARRALLGPVFATLGWERAHGEDERAQVLRATLVRRLGTTGADPVVRAEAVARFDGGVVEGDLADAIVAVVNSMRRPGDYDEMLRRFQEAKDPLTEERYRQGLAGVADEALCLRLYDTCFDEFRMQDAPIVVARLMANRVGGRAVWEAVTSHWDEYLATVPPPMHFVFAIGLAFQVADTRVRRARRRVPSQPSAGRRPAARRPGARVDRRVGAARRSRAPDDGRRPCADDRTGRAPCASRPAPRRTGAH